jgi:hypothetical protein
VVHINVLTEEEHEELRRLLEEGKVVSVGESVRAYVEQHMPELKDKLPIANAALRNFRSQRRLSMKRRYVHERRARSRG